MINVKKQKRHTKLFRIHKILSKHDRRICQKDNIINRFVAKWDKIWMNKIAKRSFQNIKARIRRKESFRNIRSRWANDTLHELFRSSTRLMHSAKRTIDRILLQEIDSRKDKLYHNRQENASYSSKSRLLKNIHSRIQKKDHSLYKLQKSSLFSLWQKAQLKTITMSKRDNSLRFRDQTYQRNKQYDNWCFKSKSKLWSNEKDLKITIEKKWNDARKSENIRKNMRRHSTNSWLKNIETSKRYQDFQKSAKNNEHAYTKEACWEVHKELFKMCNDEIWSTRTSEQTSIIEIIKTIVSKHCTRFHHETFKVKRLYNKSHVRHDNDRCERIHQARKIHIVQNHNDNKTIDVLIVENNILRKRNLEKDSFEQR